MGREACIGSRRERRRYTDSHSSSTGVGGDAGGLQCQSVSDTLTFPLTSPMLSPRSGLKSRGWSHRAWAPGRNCPTFHWRVRSRGYVSADAPCKGVVLRSCTEQTPGHTPARTHTHACAHVCTHARGVGAAATVELSLPPRFPQHCK